MRSDRLGFNCGGIEGVAAAIGCRVRIQNFDIAAWRGDANAIVIAHYGGKIHHHNERIVGIAGAALKCEDTVARIVGTEPLKALP